MDRMMIAKSRLPDWVSKLQESAEVYAPAVQGDITCFARLGKGAMPLLDYGNTDLPAKEVLFPQSECMIRWQRTPEGLAVSEAQPGGPRVVFGVRPCDATALRFLDHAFSLGGIVDPYYMRRREQTTVIALCCREPVPGCFGPSVGVDELSPEGADIVLTDIGEALVAEAKTAKGEAAIAAGGDAFSPPSEQELQAAKAAGERLLEALKEQALALDEPQTRAARLLVSTEWDQITRRCLSCGICAFLCPTCHCFDIWDQPAHGGGERVRCYDTCTSKLYNRQAGGHNPRPTPRERLQQRLLHKFDYAPQRLEGLLGCVGCARCRRCPVDIDLQLALSEMEIA
jgi:ferredoxin